MARTPKTLQVVLGNTDTDIYAVPVGGKADITEIIVGNGDTATRWFTANRYSGSNKPIGGSQKKLSGTSNTDYGGGEWVWQGAMRLTNGEKLTGIAEVGSVITVTVNLIEEV